MDQYPVQELDSSEINLALERAKEARKELRLQIRNVQLSCEHVDLAYADSAPPIRICLNCGMTEDGWGSGFRVLVPRGKGKHSLVPEISINNLYHLNQGLRLSSEKKIGLVQNKKTLADLIEDWYQGG